MKANEYTSGEIYDYESVNFIGFEKTDLGFPFAYLFPQSSLVIHLNEDWISIDDEDVGSRVRKKFADELKCICNSAIEKFYPGIDASVSIRNLTAKNSKISRNQRTTLFLVGPGKTGEIADKLSHVTGLVCARAKQTQPDLLIKDDFPELLAPETEFLEGQVNGLRKNLSGVKINHPFGVENFGSTSVITGFSGEFDSFEFEIPAAEEIFGIASIDGFREFHNTVYLTIIDCDEISEASKNFAVQDTTLLKMIMEAKYYDKKIRYIADKVFDNRPDKPTFILKSIEILGQM